MTVIMLGNEHHLLTQSELATLGGAVSTVVLVANGLYSALGWKPRTTGLIASFLVALFGAASAEIPTWQTWVLSVPNTFVIYLSAIGASGVASSPPKRNTLPAHSSAEEVARENPAFFVAWY